ncbi:MAG: hypothetical protein JWM89_2946 [Acidimicrobiales bacterium]|nr:hypothetical protein [Acidimicrobiales bacterium]
MARTRQAEVAVCHVDGPTARPVPSIAVSPLAGPLFAAALLVALAGIAKLSRPAAARVALRTAGLPSTAVVVRALGAGELLLAGVVLAVGGRLGGALIAAAYLAFAAFAAFLASRSRRAVPCGCFGSGSAPVGPLHVGVNLALAAVGAAAVVRPSDDLVSVARATPLAGIPFVGFTVLLTWLLLVLLTALPELLAAAKPTKAAAR